MDDDDYVQINHDELTSSTSAPGSSSVPIADYTQRETDETGTGTSEHWDDLFRGMVKTKQGLFGSMSNAFCVVTQAYVLELFPEGSFTLPGDNKPVRGTPFTQIVLRNSYVRYTIPQTYSSNNTDEVDIVLECPSRKKDVLLRSIAGTAQSLYAALSHAIQRSCVLDPGYSRVVALPTQPRILIVTVLEGLLPKVDRLGECDPFVKISVDSFSQQTHTIGKVLYSSWGTQYAFPCREQSNMVLGVYDRNVTTDAHIGEFVIGLRELFTNSSDGVAYQGWAQCARPLGCNFTSVMPPRVHIRLAMGYDFEARKCLHNNVVLCRESIDQCVASGDPLQLTRANVPWELALSGHQTMAPALPLPIYPPTVPTIAVPHVPPPSYAAGPFEGYSRPPPAYCEQQTPPPTYYAPQQQMTARTSPSYQVPPPQPFYTGVPGSSCVPPDMQAKPLAPQPDAQTDAWPDSSVDNIMALGVSRRGANVILGRVNGNVDAAANILLDNLDLYQRTYPPN